MSAFHILMSELIDYAGLFPPAALSMKDAAVEYRRWITSPGGWMVGRFVCPVARLGELARESQSIADQRWNLSVLAGDPLERDLDSITAFLDETAGRFDVPSLEIRVASAANLESCLDALETVEDGVTAYFEMPLAGDYRGLITAIAGTRHGAKIRTGGVSADLIPSVNEVVKFVLACREAQVPFKATAGLHHPVRHFDAPLNGRMHGFLNVFLAAALALKRDVPQEAVAAAVRTEKIDSFTFSEDHCRALDWTLTQDDLSRARGLAVSFGSCSIAEPVEDLRSLGLLPLAAEARAAK